ncbi:MAG: peptide MFS transporter [Acidobacteria bacterium]|nr:peptide MFS transporter [Acidobacteriota bacterium]
MSAAETATDPRLLDTGGIAGHPRGLMILFFTEMWERFSYYGMRALLVLFLVAPPERGGLGFSVAAAAGIYSTYTMSVYMASLPGGWVADRWLGQRRAIVLGGILIALGEFILAASGTAQVFYAGLGVIVAGTGLLKTNCATMVGTIYAENDARRDAGFSIYYMGVNIGALVAPLVCGFLAQDPRFMAFLGKVGLATASGWRWGFGAAGVAMVLGLIQFLIMQGRFGEAGLKPGYHQVEHGHASAREPLTAEEKKRLWVVAILFVFSMIFWATYEQAGSSLNLFADRYTRSEVLGFSFPSTWFQSVNSTWLLMLAPIISWLWVKLGDRGPSSPAKFAAGLLFVGLGVLLLVPAANIAEGGTRVGPWWLVGTFFFHTVGELCLSPVGLSTTTKLAPARYQGLMMGVWYLSLALGNKLAGKVAGLFETMPLGRIYGSLFLVTASAALLLWLLTPRIRKLMGGVR